jgi:hypothetical protein
VPSCLGQRISVLFPTSVHGASFAEFHSSHFLRATIVHGSIPVHLRGLNDHMEIELADLSEQLIASQEPARPHSLFIHSSTLILSIIAFLFSVGCCYFALFSVSFRHGLVSSATEHPQMETECLKPLAIRYSCPEWQLFPTQIDTSRWARWASSLI